MALYRHSGRPGPSEDDLRRTLEGPLLPDLLGIFILLSGIFLAWFVHRADVGASFTILAFFSPYIVYFSLKLFLKRLLA